MAGAMPGLQRGVVGPKVPVVELVDAIRHVFERCHQGPGGCDAVAARDQHAVSNGSTQPLVEAGDEEVAAERPEADGHLREGLRTVDQGQHTTFARQLAQALGRKHAPRPMQHVRQLHHARSRRQRIRVGAHDGVVIVERIEAHRHDPDAFPCGALLPAAEGTRVVPLGRPPLRRRAAWARRR